MSEKLSKYTKPRLFSIHYFFAVEKVSLSFLEVKQFFRWKVLKKLCLVEKNVMVCCEILRNVALRNCHFMVKICILGCISTCKKGFARNFIQIFTDIDFFTDSIKRPIRVKGVNRSSIFFQHMWNKLRILTSIHKIIKSALVLSVAQTFCRSII